MSVRIAARIPDDLAERIEARRQVEQRTLSNMVERLLTLGLGTVVVTERNQGDLESTGRTLPGSPFPLRSVTTCPNEHFHRPGSYCKSCDRVI